MQGDICTIGQKIRYLFYYQSVDFLTAGAEIKTQNSKGDVQMEIRLGESIRKLRKEAGFTQEQLSEALGVSVSAVHKWGIRSMQTLF